jgi:hypothetical protein
MTRRNASRITHLSELTVYRPKQQRSAMMWSLKHEKWFLTHRHNGSCHLTWPKSVFRTSDPSAQLFLQGDALIETRCTHCLKFSGRVAYPSNTHRQTVCLDTILSSDPQSDPQKELSRQRWFEPRRPRHTFQSTYGMLAKTK